MALCAVLYLAWWVVFFRPDAGKVQGPLYWIGAGCLVVAAIAGVAGAVFIALGASGLAAGTGPNGWWFALSAIAAYILLAWATAHFGIAPSPPSCCYSWRGALWSFMPPVLWKRAVPLALPPHGVSLRSSSACSPCHLPATFCITAWPPRRPS